jgi:hypothetical protein
MAGGFPVGLQWSAVQAVPPSNTYGIPLAAPATPSTLSAFVQLIASTARDSTWCLINVVDYTTSVGLASGFMNLAIGASGSEAVIVTGLSVPRGYSSSSISENQACYLFPLVLPAGTRLAAQIQSWVASELYRVNLALFDDAFGSVCGGGAIDTYGYNSGTSQGTTLDAGATANTKGAYVQLTGSTTNDLAGFFLGFDTVGSSPGSVDAAFSLDIAVGASGSEVIVFPDFPVHVKNISSPARNITPIGSPYFPIPVPAGSRVAARVQCSSTTSTVRVLNVIFYGVRA